MGDRRLPRALPLTAYGAKRVHAELVLERGIRVGAQRRRVPMQRTGIVGHSGGRKRSGI
jgi:hypothetical protein